MKKDKGTRTLPPKQNEFEIFGSVIQSKIITTIPSIPNLIGENIFN